METCDLRTLDGRRTIWARTMGGRTSVEAPTRNVRYLLDASRRCGHDVTHWLRYLRKFVRNGAPALSPSEVEYLSNCGDLSLCQRVVLERGMEAGTPTFGYLIALNEPARTPMIDLIRAELRGDVPTNP